MKVYTHIGSFLELESDSEEEFRALTKVIEDQDIIKNKQFLVYLRKKTKNSTSFMTILNYDFILQ